MICPGTVGGRGLLPEELWESAKSSRVIQSLQKDLGRPVPWQAGGGGSSIGYRLFRRPLSCEVYAYRHIFFKFSICHNSKSSAFQGFDVAIFIVPSFNCSLGQVFYVSVFQFLITRVFNVSMIRLFKCSIFLLFNFPVVWPTRPSRIAPWCLYAISYYTYYMGFLL